jgi:hypothetical protein
MHDVGVGPPFEYTNFNAERHAAKKPKDNADKC